MVAYWSYDSGHLPESYHTEAAIVDGVLDWLKGSPYLRYDGSLAGRWAIEGVLLAVGLFLRDICAGQFSQGDPDEASSLPAYVSQSGIPFSVIDEQLLPFCTWLQEVLQDPPAPPHAATPVGKGKGRVMKRVDFVSTSRQGHSNEPTTALQPRATRPLPRPRQKHQPPPPASAEVEMDLPQAEPASPSRKERPPKRVKLSRQKSTAPEVAQPPRTRSQTQGRGSRSSKRK